MCIVIDTCAISRVFTAGDADFDAVRRWIVEGRGKMVFGGTKYNEELLKLGRYLAVIQELTRQRKTVVVNRDLVDEAEARVREMEPCADFDDPHIVAIVKVSRCRVVCSTDARADRFVQDRRFYGAPVPSIYRHRDHGHLLRDCNIVGACV